MFFDYRLFYTKTGRLKYISHLDVNRLMQRALNRSGLPVWYSEGFNPHIYITFALPLALGIESTYEVMDFRLTTEFPENEIADAITRSLPEEMAVISVAKPIEKPQAIASAEYEVTFRAGQIDLESSWNRFIDQPSIMAEKKTKRGIKELDLKSELISSSYHSTGEGVTVVLRLPAGSENNVSPLLLTDAFFAFMNEPAINTEYKKTGVFTKENKLFK